MSRDFFSWGSRTLKCPLLALVDIQKLAIKVPFRGKADIARTWLESSSCIKRYSTLSSREPILGSTEAPVQSAQAFNSTCRSEPIWASVTSPRKHVGRKENSCSYQKSSRESRSRVYYREPSRAFSPQWSSASVGADGCSEARQENGGIKQEERNPYGSCAHSFW